ncbi:MAG: ABC transporter ATP-binding protein [Actinobacteria bacterium]|nr:ABC transporter ATP-binding protein [Actinomycetota bacterium]
MSAEIDAAVGVRVGTLDLDATVTIEPGETVALLGPNGAGKTTFLHAVCGLRPVDAGRIVLDGAVVDDPVGHVFVPPERRRVGVVFQDYLLFEHLSARENVAFGPRCRGVGRVAAARAADALLARVGLSDLGDAKPCALSGGQTQRVALARALAGDPGVLLLDEPLAALDATTRDAVRRELRALLVGFPGARLLVTHDPIDAAILADRVVVLEQGRVVQAGTVTELAAQPQSRFVADLVGVNLLHGIARGDHVELDGGARLVAPEPAYGAVLAAIYPHAVSLHAREPAGSARNTWRGRVSAIELLGTRARVRVDGAVPLVAEVTPAALDALGLAPGAQVWCSVKATEVAVYGD